MPQPIKPLSGFPELLPNEQIILEKYISIVRKNFELYGFTPIETPAVERKTTLVSKGGDEKEIYSLSRLSAEDGEDKETEMALHFDLTVPLARYVAMYKNSLIFPFRRYQIQKVWRGERAQAGRFREFYQCDIDVIGLHELSLDYDAELPAIIYSIFDEFSLGSFLIRINNRKILSGYLSYMGVQEAEKVEVFQVIDKLEKIPKEKVEAEIKNKTSLSTDGVKGMVEFLTHRRSTEETLMTLSCINGNSLLKEGIDEVTAVIEGLRQRGVPESFYTLDLSVVRGLDYYTGTVYETRLSAYPELGSVCSGGRYDNLSSLFSEDVMPGVGVSIGISRLILYLLKKGEIKPSFSTSAPVLIAMLDDVYVSKYLQISNELRKSGIANEVFLEKKKTLKTQMKYADRKGFQYVLILGESEIEKNAIQIKNMLSGSSEIIDIDKLVDFMVSKQVSN